MWPLHFELPASGPITDVRRRNAPADRSSQVAIAQNVGANQWGSAVFAHRIVAIRLVEGRLVEARNVVLDFKHDDPARNLATSKLLLAGLAAEK